MCVDNPRTDFSDLFATHPSVDRRVAALVEFAGGQDPGPIALPPPPEETAPEQDAAPAAGPWSEAGREPASDRPFLPAQPPVALGEPPPPPGPWDPRRGS
jgi:heat shock protein HtpX